MKLSQFVVENIDAILREWETLVRKNSSNLEEISSITLHTDAKKILIEIVSEMEKGQYQKRIPFDRDNAEMISEINIAASRYGIARLMNGFTLVHLTAEYHALRSTVLRLWSVETENPDSETIRQILAFCEILDESLLQSSISFSMQSERARDTFLAILGHDLRGPLATMGLAGEFLTMPGVEMQQIIHAGNKVKRSAATMETMVNDLLDYSRNQLGGKMPISVSLTDAQEISKIALEDAKAIYPGCIFRMEARGDTLGQLDSARMQQVISNLLNNAAQHGDKKQPIYLTLNGDSDGLVIKVINKGPNIPVQSLTNIFNPLMQLSVTAESERYVSKSLGLGLFIAREITEAHGGTIRAESSSDSGTIFTVQLPRKI